MSGLEVPILNAAGQTCLKVAEIAAPFMEPAGEQLVKLIMKNGGETFLQNLENINNRRAQMVNAGFHLPSLSDIHMPEWPKGITLAEIKQVLETPQARIAMLASSLAKYGYDYKKARKKKKKRKQSMDDLNNTIKKQESRLKL